MTLKGKVLKEIPDYYQGRLQRVFVNPCINSRPHPERVHKLVLITFVGPRPDGMEACHYDGNPANNAISNLRWDNDKNNQSDSMRHGTKHTPPIHYGERHPRSKLTKQAVKEIRATKFKRGVFKSLAQKYGVLPITVSRVFHGEAWRGQPRHR